MKALEEIMQKAFAQIAFIADSATSAVKHVNDVKKDVVALTSLIIDLVHKNEFNKLAGAVTVLAKVVDSHGDAIVQLARAQSMLSNAVLGRPLVQVKESEDESETDEGSDEQFVPRDISKLN